MQVKQGLQRLRRAASMLQADPKMQRTISAVVKAMGLMDPLPKSKEPAPK